MLAGPETQRQRVERGEAGTAHEPRTALSRHRPPPVRPVGKALLPGRAPLAGRGRQPPRRQRTARSASRADRYRRAVPVALSCGPARSGRSPGEPGRRMHADGPARLGRPARPLQAGVVQPDLQLQGPGRIGDDVPPRGARRRPRAGGQFGQRRFRGGRLRRRCRHPRQDHRSRRHLGGQDPPGPRLRS